MDTIGKKSFDLTIRGRLFLGFLILTIPLIIMACFFAIKINRVMTLNEEINRLNIPSTLDSEIYETRAILYYWALTGDSESKEAFAQAWSEIKNTVSIVDESLHQSQNKELITEWNRLKNLYGPLEIAQQKVLNLPWERGSSSIVQGLVDIRPMGDEMINIITGSRSSINGEREGGLYHMRSKEIDDKTEIVVNELNHLAKLALAALALIILLSLLVPILTARSILGPLNQAIEIAEKISAGERHLDIMVTSNDETGKLLSSLKAMQSAIGDNEIKLSKSEQESRSLFERIVESSKKFRIQSSKVAAGDLRERLEISKDDVMQDLGNDLNTMTDSLASITKKITLVSGNIINMVEKIMAAANEESESITSEASAINEISASLEEIDKSSKQTMIRAQTLRESARSTYEQGKLGTQLVNDSIKGIKASAEKVRMIEQTILDLSHHTQQIGEITKVVNTLAQQLKMLALNAAIEASKAGEAGKGFAAVATEVRNLAEQSEQSTDQVQKILEDIRLTTEKAVVVTKEGTKTLDVGTDLIEKTGDVVQTLSKMIDEATISSQQIEAAIRQEAVGIEQIVASMNEINRATKTLAGGVNETNNFIHELAEIAQHLKEDINTYKV